MDKQKILENTPKNKIIIKSLILFISKIKKKIDKNKNSKLIKT